MLICHYFIMVNEMHIMEDRHSITTDELKDFQLLKAEREACQEFGNYVFLILFEYTVILLVCNLMIGLLGEYYFSNAPKNNWEHIVPSSLISVFVVLTLELKLLLSMASQKDH